jgi:hypothetical protein
MCFHVLQLFNISSLLMDECQLLLHTHCKQVATHLLLQQHLNTTATLLITTAILELHLLARRARLSCRSVQADFFPPQPGTAINQFSSNRYKSVLPSRGETVSNDITLCCPVAINQNSQYPLYISPPLPTVNQSSSTHLTICFALTSNQGLRRSRGYMTQARAIN